MFGHRFIVLSLGIFSTIAFILDKSLFSFPFIDNVLLSHQLMYAFILTFFVSWIYCLLIRGKLVTEDPKKDQIVNGFGLFAYFIAILSLLGLKIGG